MKVVIGSGNQDKIKEIRNIFKNTNLQFEPYTDYDEIPEVVEDGNNLFENAYKKAKEISKHLDYPVISDDTGLEVDILGGAPGVYSARYAGENASYTDNVNKLLDELDGINTENRTAQFRTVCVFFDSGEYIQSEGIIKGRILETPVGKNGFGYDPVFYIEKEGKTFAQMSEDKKNNISHRGKAIRNLYQKLLKANILQEK